MFVTSPIHYVKKIRMLASIALIQSCLDSSTCDKKLPKHLTFHPFQYKVLINQIQFMKSGNILSTSPLHGVEKNVDYKPAKNFMSHELNSCSLIGI